MVLEGIKMSELLPVDGLGVLAFLDRLQMCRPHGLPAAASVGSDFTIPVANRGGFPLEDERNNAPAIIHFLLMGRF